jgi:hypothetical protein
MNKIHLLAHPLLWRWQETRNARGFIHSENTNPCRVTYYPKPYQRERNVNDEGTNRQLSANSVRGLFLGSCRTDLVPHRLWRVWGG